MQLGKRALSKTRPDSPGVDEAMLAGVLAQQERPEVTAAAAGFCKPANHEFLAQGALHLKPVEASAGRVRPAESLGNDALQMQSGRFGKKFRAAANHMIAVVERPFGRQ